MNGFRTLAFSLTSIAVFAAQSIALLAQTAATPSQGPSISVSLALANDHVPVGESPQAVVTMRNISKETKCFRTAQYLYRMHVAGKDGGPPATDFERKRLAPAVPGDGSAPAEDATRCLYIAPGDWVHLNYDLGIYYDFREPGTYTVSMELMDESKDKLGTGVWLKTNSAQFEVQAPAQAPAQTQSQAPAQAPAPAK